MAPPPPSQAGRFKPRKPAKRGRQPVSVTSAPTPITVPGKNSSEASAATNAEAAVVRGGRSSSSGRGGQEARGGGRGRGRGRGRGAPIAQGNVFFTGADKPTTTNRASAVAAKRSPQGGRGGTGTVASAKGPNFKEKSVALEVQEEILDTGEDEIVSKPAPKPDKATSNNLTFADDFHEVSNSRYQSTSTNANSDLAGQYYDSDSSQDEDGKVQKRFSSLQPIILSEPRHPTGNAAEVSSEQRDQHAPLKIESMSARKSRLTGSPLLQLSSLQTSGDESSFFLVQLPTRLPDLVDERRPEADRQEASGIASSTITPALDEEKIAVSTPAVETDAFDNKLADAKSGLFGKILVYKSGKAVLVFDGANGEPGVRMNVNQGLDCKFRQQAVAVDLEQNVLQPVGHVSQTLVITPDLPTS